MTDPKKPLAFVTDPKTPLAFVRKYPPEHILECQHLYVLLEDRKPFRAGDYLLASALHAPDREPEVYLFRSDAHGKITNDTELPGSQRGTLNIDQVLTDANYVVVGDLN